MNPLLSIKDVSIYYISARHKDVCQNISLNLYQGECVGLIGESGCGKSTLLKSIQGLLSDEGVIRRGSIDFAGESLMNLDTTRYQAIQTTDIAMVFQDCMNAFNPSKRIGIQAVELYVHRFGINKKEAKQQVMSILGSVGFQEVHRLMRSYPYQLSGGMLQRVGLAMVFMIQPQLILADEPTSALDVVSAQHILAMLKDYIETTKGTLLLTSHQFSVVSAICHRVLVMYEGYVVEEGITSDILSSPLHPYTINLVCCATYDDHPTRCQMHAEIDSMPSGCVFQHRCHIKKEICSKKQPPLIEVAGGRKVACFHVT